MKKSKQVISALLVLSLLVSLGIGVMPVSAAGTTGAALYVAVDGSDSAAGTMDAPLATLEGARDAIRAMSDAEKANGVTVYLRGGVYYRLGDSFRLEAQDSGKEGAPVTYAAYPGEDVEIRGSLTVDGGEFEAVTDQAILDRLPDAVEDSVRVLDLGAMGNTSFSPIQQTGLGWPDKAPAMSVTVDGQKQTLARYPNSGNLTITTLHDGGFVPRNHMILLANGYCVEGCFDICKYPPETWPQQAKPSWTTIDSALAGKAALWEQEDEIWVQGYFCYDWAEDNLQVAATAVDGGMRFDAAMQAFYGVGNGRPYYAYNLLCELDVPGEFYLDRTNAKLYLYPQTDIRTSSVNLSMMGNSFVRADDVEYVNIENIRFQHSNGHGVELLDCNHMLVAGCAFYDLGQRAVMIGENCTQSEYQKQNTGSRGGTDNTVLSCDIRSMGQGGIFLAGGNRYTLTDGNNQVINCDIQDFSVIKRTDSPAVEIVGCGNKVLNNRIYNAPHNAILFFGNNHVMRNNELYKLMYETSDTGAFYAGRSWTYQGNRIDNNYVHDLYTNAGVGSSVVYLDDMASGTAVTNNLFVNIPGRTVLFGGGRDIVFRNNIQINQGNGAGLTSDHRALGWGDTMAAKPGGELYVEFMSLIQNQDFDWDAWTGQYPALMEMVDRQTKDMKGLERRTLSNGQTCEIAWQYMTPADNIIEDNILVGVAGESLSSYLTDPTLAQANHNVYDGSIRLPAGTDIGFADAASQDFAVKAGSTIQTELGDAHFDASSVGLFNDAYRSNASVQIGAPTLTAPADGAVDVPYVSGVALCWKAVDGADSYQVEVAADADFTDVILSKRVDHTAWTAGPLEKKTTYYWRVTAMQDHLNGTSAASSVQSFTTNGEEGFSFYESFGGSDYAFAAWNRLGGTPTTTDAMAHAGSYSYILDESLDCLDLTLPVAARANLSVWMYDTCYKGDRIEFCAGVDTPEGKLVTIGVNEFDSTGDPDYYSIRIGDSYTVTGIGRTEGWHKLEWIWNGETTLGLYIDGVQAGAAEGVSAVDRIILGDLWSATGPATGVMFDDLTFGEPVVEPVYSGLTLSQTELTLAVGEEFQLKAVVEATPDVTPAMNWSTVGTEIVYVTDGKLTAAREGTDTVQVSIPGTDLIASCQVTVVAAAEKGVPAMVTGLTAQSLGGSKAMLGWNAAERAETYRVYRNDGSGWTAVAEGVTGERWVDTGLTGGSTYQYRVAAVNEQGESTPSVCVSLKIIDAVFHEDFEDENCLDDWAAFGEIWNKGKVQTDYAHTGRCGFMADTTPATSAGAFTGLTTYFDEPMDKLVEIWLYDANLSGQMMNAVLDTGNNIYGLGVLQVGIGQPVNANYVVKTPTSEIPTTVARSVGWHQILLDATTDHVLKMYLDGAEVAACEGFSGIGGILVYNAWGASAMGELYVDDITLQNERPVAVQADPAAEAAAKLIEAIGTVTEESGEAIKMAREAYDALEDKRAIPNLDTLLAAEAAYEALINPARSITVIQPDNGTITLSHTEAKAGELITVTATADEGYELQQILVSGAAITGSTFEMPAEAVTVTAVFMKKEEPGGNPEPEEPEKPIAPVVPIVPGKHETGEKDREMSFTDVPGDAWYHDAVCYACEMGLMNGLPGGIFDPNGITTRGMIVTILYRLEGSPADFDGSLFSDVSASAYYADAVAWAAAKGIVTGYDNHTFGPDDAVTRQQLAAILLRYAQNKGYGTDARADLSACADAGEIGVWAVDGMRWAVAEGLITGRGADMLAPAGTATRAEVAMILTRYQQKLMQ